MKKILFLGLIFIPVTQVFAAQKSLFSVWENENNEFFDLSKCSSRNQYDECVVTAITADNVCTVTMIIQPLSTDQNEGYYDYNSERKCLKETEYNPIAFIGSGFGSYKKTDDTLVLRDYLQGQLVFH